MNWPCKIHGYECPCRGRTCTQDHPGMCIYFDTAEPTGIPARGSFGSQLHYESGSVHGLGADSVAADIMQWAEQDMIEEGFDEIGFGGGRY